MKDKDVSRENAKNTKLYLQFHSALRAHMGLFILKGYTAYNQDQASAFNL